MWGKLIAFVMGLIKPTKTEQPTIVVNITNDNVDGAPAKKPRKKAAPKKKAVKKRPFKK